MYDPHRCTAQLSQVMLFWNRKGHITFVNTNVVRIMDSEKDTLLPLDEQQEDLFNRDKPNLLVATKEDGQQQQQQRYRRQRQNAVKSSSPFFQGARVA
jgi:PAS domain-containing protein